MARYGNLDYPKLAKYGFLVGLAMFLVGGIGELIGHTVLGGLPGWEQTLLLDLEILGVLVGLFAPLTFGIILPLTE